MAELDPAGSRAQALAWLAGLLDCAGIEQPRREARLLFSAVTGIAAAELVLAPEARLGSCAALLAEAGRRRAAGEPLARIVGRKEFFGLDFALSPATLVPRPDTEVLVEAVLDHAARRGLAQRPLRLLDLGTGSGNLLIALLSRLPQAKGIGIDRSEAALTTAQHNARTHDLAARAAFCCGHWFDPVVGSFDLIVSNPPYIETGEIATLDREVREHDPRAALDGGADGLEAYREILARLPAFLAAGGIAGLELGAGQSDSVSAIAQGAGLAVIEARKDLAGHRRALILAHAT